MTTKKTKMTIAELRAIRPKARYLHLSAIQGKVPGTKQATSDASPGRRYQDNRGQTYEVQLSGAVKRV